MPGQASLRIAIQLTANFERNLEEIERFLTEAEAAHAYDDPIDALLETVLPNLWRFPTMGRSFRNRLIGSVEASNGIDLLREKLAKINPDSEIREYVLDHYLMLYALADKVIYLPAIRHHRQLSFDFNTLWLS